MDASFGVDGYSIGVAAGPWSPWFRLAHCWNHRPAQASGDVGSLRRLRDFEFFLQIEGDGWLDLAAAGGRVLIPPGSLALIPPGPEHAWGGRAGMHLAVHFDLHAQPAITERDLMVYTGPRGRMSPVIPPPAVRLRGTDLHWPLVLALDDPAAWRRRFEPLLAIYAGGRRDSPAVRLQAAGILAGAVAEFLRLSAEPHADRLDAALAAVAAEDPPRQHAIAELAARAGMGETAFRAAVRARTGHAPHAWLERLRMRRALMLLSVHRLGVQETARRCGYDDPYHFSRVFSRVHGHPPSRLPRMTDG